MSIEQSTILVVEDDREIQSLLVELLSVEHKVIAADHGEAALELIEGLEPDELDLVLMDLMMPKMGGHELLARLRDNFRTETIPVIILSALNEEEEKRLGLRGGAIDYIAKPFDPEMLFLKINNHIEQKHRQDRLHQMSMIDVVTNLYNRRQFDLRLEEEWSRCARSGSDLALLMIDIDYFKRYNDTYGHSAGDNCLARVANAIQSVFMRSSDFVARYGGEEFVVILPETELNGAIKLANQVLMTLDELAIPNRGSKIGDRITASIGVAAVKPDSSTPIKQLIVAADKLLYHAKESGRNCVMPSRKISKIAWAEQFSVGHPLMDRHHQVLVGYINQLIDEVNSEASLLNSNIPSSETLPLLAKIRTFAAMHFKSEEGLLGSIGYPNLEEQCASHQHYERELCSSQLGRRDPEAIYELVTLLRNWWERHILVDDMAYKAYVEKSAR